MQVGVIKKKLAKRNISYKILPDCVDTHNKGQHISVHFISDLYW